MPFVQEGIIKRRILPASIGLTVVGSGVGAFLLIKIQTKPLQLTIAIAMIVVAVFSLLKQNHENKPPRASMLTQASGYLLTFAIAVYGGFFSGGYVTMLTAVFVLFFGITFLQAIATTKVINIFSSLVATVIFALRGIVDYRLGIVLGVVMFLGAVLGGHVAMRLPAVWLRRIFLGAVVVLALKMMIPFAG